MTTIKEVYQSARGMHEEPRGKGYYCTMVRGSCRGALCDFWARAKIRKASVDELVALFRGSTANCEKDNGSTITDEAFLRFWKDFGVKNMALLCKEEPELYGKIRQVQQAILE